MNTILPLGHLGLLDSVPLLVAQKHGFFTAAGLQVELHCELGLASLGAKLAEDRLAGACLPAPLPVLLSLGLGRARVAVESVLIVSYQDLAIACPPPSAARSPAPARPLRLGVLGSASPSRFVLQRWLEQKQRHPAEAVTIIPLAVSQLLAFLGDGVIDGFCAEDPLPALAACGDRVMQVTSSGEFAPMHPGSAVVLHAKVLRQNPGLRPALTHALQRACRYCSDPAHHEELWSLIRDQPALAHLHASAGSPDEAAPLAWPDAAPRCGVRYLGPDTPHGLDVAGAGFLERACRAMAGAGARHTDFRVEIARVYGVGA